MRLAMTALLILAAGTAMSQIKKGFILCSADYPAQVGFRLVDFKNLDKPYQGEWHLTDTLFVTGTYHPQSEKFSFTLNEVIDEYENSRILVKSGGVLTGGETWALDLPLEAEERSVAFTCRVHRSF